MRWIMTHRLMLIIPVALPLVLASCTVKPPEITVTGEKTVLERQLFGDYELSPKSIFLPAASGGIYTPDSIGLPDTLHRSDHPRLEVESGRKEYLSALANHRFNLDDVDKFKDIGVLGEDNRGYLYQFNDKVFQLPPPDAAVLKEVLDEENRGRRIIMLRVIALRADLTEENLPEIEKIFAQRNFQEEKPGRMVQADNGEWIIKK
ncbi:MAG: hypothetical protein CO189_01980 [candidate division Zixibacteria bacterium CG_4_9_14_3_um_filter_46_8]|nr:MAG: hypothetical protein CO189_01980 [candidate division Zixibacteria bacterium CG_4_9_14_3_um_filter_46_8]